MVATRMPLPFRSQAAPPSGWGIGGILAAGGPSQDEVKAVLGDLRSQPALVTHVRPNPLLGNTWSSACSSGIVQIPRMAHVLDLQAGFEEVWTKRINGRTRNKVRRAVKLGVTVEKDTSGKLVPVFYNLFLQSVDRWAAQQNEPTPLAHWRAKRRDPIEKFAGLAQRMGEAFNLWIAWYQGQPAAAILVLQGKNAHYTRGAMNKDLAGPSYANYLLHKMAIEDACQNGCRYYHMGESGTSKALAHFKSRFGAVAYGYAEYRIERLPITTIDGWLRNFVKKIIKFKD
jgi:lipid II:glycine glycyltransferase (peptidoglycan interpeptide bridge formation enzyme)